jgi:hypothetical protein
MIIAMLCISEVAAMRTNVKSRQSLNRQRARDVAEVNTSKTPDLDWPGCGSKLWSLSSQDSCRKQEGCDYHKVWLDTKRQSCRYTVEYKLEQDQVERFFPVELARLEEKTEIFAKKGCITGGWMWKCYRRMQQIIRLFNYLRKAKAAVLKEGESHPAFATVVNTEVEETLARISKNLATGFSKNKETKGMCLDKGMQKIISIPEEIREIQKKAEDAGYPLSEKELETLEQAKQTSAMLMMTCQEVSEEKEQEIRALIEAGYAGEGSSVSGSVGNDDLDDMVDDQEHLLDMMDGEDRKALQEAEGNDESLLETVSEPESDEYDLNLEDGKTPLGNQSAMLQLDTESSLSSSAGPLKLLLVGGWKGLKWLLKNGIGWLFQRLVWTIVFLLGFALSLVRSVVLFPVLFITCLAVRSLHWFWVDLMWNGKDIKKGFYHIGHCAPEMWSLVGFDADQPFGSAVGQIVVQPARFASNVSGVYHPFKSGRPEQPNPCRRVKCGTNAHCRNVPDRMGNLEAKCFCYTGTYPDTALGSLGKKLLPTCSFATSRNGCECMQSWSSGWTLYHGCNYYGECKINRKLPSFKRCREKNNADVSPIRGSINWMMGKDKHYDKCVYHKSPQEVPVVSIDDTIDDFGKKVEKQLSTQ